MPKMTYYHNPRCSKSRQALALLEEQNIQPTIVEYLKAPLSEKNLKTLLSQLNLNASALIRKTEPHYKTEQLSTKDDNALIKAIVAHPILMQRPIFVNNNKAVIGRPPEAVLDIL